MLALIPSKDWFYGAVIVGLVVFMFYERHQGAAHEAAAVAAATSKLEIDTAKKTADLQARATMAEQAYDKERNALGNLPAPVARLCINGGSPVVPQAGSAQRRDERPSASPSTVQQVPAGDSESAGPDIGGMLGALAASADQVSATLREYQSR